MKNITKDKLFYMSHDELKEVLKELNSKGIYKYDSLINWLLMG